MHGILYELMNASDKFISAIDQLINAIDELIIWHPIDQLINAIDYNKKKVTTGHGMN